MFNIFVGNILRHSCHTLSGAQRAAVRLRYIETHPDALEICQMGEGYWRDRIIKRWVYSRNADGEYRWQITPIE